MKIIAPTSIKIYSDFVFGSLLLFDLLALDKQKKNNNRETPQEALAFCCRNVIP
jgi:hypothetical protein